MEGQFQGDGVVLENAVGFWVQRVFAAMRVSMYESFRVTGVEMTPEQWMVLVRLWEREGVSQNELCESTLKDKPTISRILGGMERRGWVRRRPDPRDGRGRLVTLTPAARALRKRLVPRVKDLVGRLEAGIPLSDLRSTRRTLECIFQNLTGTSHAP